MARGRQGIALVTALFAVVLVFGLVTAQLAQLRGDQALTRDLDFRLQTRSLARSAVQAALSELNRDPAWESEHTGEDLAATRKLGDHTLRFWVEPTTQANVLRIRGQAEGAEGMMLVTRGGGPGGLLVGASDALFQSNPDGSFTLLPAGPEKLQRAVGGPQGEVYAGAKKRVYRLDPNSPRWVLLPELPIDGKPKSMTVDGAGQLYVLGSNQILAFRHEAWETLTAPPGDLSSLSADHAGRLWVVADERTPYRYDKAWQRVSEVPATQWTRQQGQLVQQPLGQPKIKSAVADPQGNLILSGPKNSGIVTLYRFVPDESTGPVLGGTYHILPAVPKRIFDKNNGQVEVQAPENEYAKKADELALDGSGQLYFRMVRDDFDTLYTTSLEGSPQYATVGPLPKVKRKNGEQVEVEGDFSKDVKSLGAGGAPGGGSPRYVPRYSE